jgi:dienelactone hydrolase
MVEAWRALGLSLLLTVAIGCGSDSTKLADRDASEDEPSDDDGGLVPHDGEDSPLEAGALDAQASDDARDARADSGAEGRDATVDAAAPGPAVDRKSPQLFELTLDPHVLDPSTTDSLTPQYAQLDTRTAPLGNLVIFLPGANNVPRDWRDHGRKLAEFGFHVLIPSYNNRWSSNDTCTGKGNTCADDTRWEALSGEDKSTALAISRADSVEGRVVTMIKHLITANAVGAWGYYLTADDGLAYGKIIIAGISHGAASAGMYAARRPFARNVMHSSGPAGSTAGAKMTPISAWYGFAHTADDAYSAIIASWNSFGLPGQPTSIDGKAAPFSDSHRLTTSATSSYPHGSVVVHSSSPKDAAGKYLFEEAWRYLYGVPAR